MRNLKPQRWVRAYNAHQFRLYIEVIVVVVAVAYMQDNSWVKLTYREYYSAACDTAKSFIKVMQYRWHSL